MKKILRSISLVALAAFLMLGFASCNDADTADNGNGGQTNETGTAPLKPKQRLKVATTTSLYDTGLWSYLEPMFEEKYNCLLYTSPSPRDLSTSRMPSSV